MDHNQVCHPADLERYEGHGPVRARTLSLADEGGRVHYGIRRCRGERVALVPATTAGRDITGNPEPMPSVGDAVIRYGT